MTQQFISEAIKPIISTADTNRMAAGEPGLPSGFTWRGTTVRVTRVLRTWRETAPCRHGSPESYARKHWYEVLTDSGSVMTLYFERQPRPRSKRGARWWLFSIAPEEPCSHDAR